jgi:hypothetical protein
MIDALRWYPILPVVGYPTKFDVVNQRMERLDAEQVNLLKSARAEHKMRDLEFELYVKRADQAKLRLEIFQNRKVDLLC